VRRRSRSGRREGVGSGREIARLVELHVAYRWLAAGVDVAYHRLNDFRGPQGDRVAQDGTRVRARAGAGSFRRGEKLAELMAEAKEHLVTVTRAASDPVGCRRPTPTPV
jgi:hypothetical protein